jgi:hypothetical protein
MKDPLIRTSTSNVWMQLLGPASYLDVVGLSTNFALTHEEWETGKEMDTKNEAIAEREAAFADLNGALLHSRIAGRQLLGDKPLNVLYCDTANDFRKVYEHGVHHGYGSEEAREEMRVIVENMAEVEERNMREHLSLSSRTRFVKAEGKARTHNVHIVDPEFVAREVEWAVTGWKTDE